MSAEAEPAKLRENKWRNWCITSSRIDDLEHRFAGLPDGVRCVVWSGVEIPDSEDGEGETAKYHHSHIYIAFDWPKRMAFVKKFIGEGNCHCERRRGSEYDAAMYVRKSGTYWEHGHFMKEGEGKGTRSDLAMACEELKKHASYKEGMRKLAEEYPMGVVRYHKGFKVLHNLLYDTPRVREPPMVVVLYGLTGKGKSFLARQLSEALGYGEVYRCKWGQGGKDLPWWPDYDEQRAILIEEFYSHKLEVSTYNELLDPYAIRVEKKCDELPPWANWELVIITTNQDPRTFYLPGWNSTKEDEAAHEAALRRISFVFSAETTEEMYEKVNKRFELNLEPTFKAKKQKITEWL